MGVTQTNTLNVIEQVNNPIPVNLSSDNLIITPGETAWIDLLVNFKQDATGLVLQISWADINLVFITKASPKNTGLDLPYGLNYTSISLWLDDIVIYLNKNELLSTNYHVWHSGDHLYFESYLKSANYTLSVITSFDWGIFAFNNGVDEVLKTNYTFNISVHVYDKTGIDLLLNPFDLYIIAKTYEITPLSNGTGIFLIQEAIKPFLKQIGIPKISNGMYKELNLLIKYYYRYAEKYGTPVVQQGVVQSANLFAVNSGFTRKDFTDTNLLAVISGATAKFLTWHPLTKWLTKNQDDYLYFIQTTTTAATYVARFVITKKDGSQQTFDQPTFFGNNQYDVHIIPTSYAFVFSLFSVDFTQFTVQMVADGIVVSETRTFKFLQNTPLNAKYFLFKNAFGVYESICFTGIKIKGVKLNKIKTIKILQISDDKTVNEVVYGNSSYNIKSKIYTGFKTKAELNAFIDFVNGKDYLEQTATYYKPVDVDVKNIELFKDKNYLSSVAITIIDNTEKNYSNA